MNSGLQNARHTDILRILQARRRVSVADLTSRLAVSEVTIRKDLALLEDMGLLTRTRGGAVLAEDRDQRRPLLMRRAENGEGKRQVATRAAQLVEEGETVYIDSGSTCGLLAEELANRTLRVVTNSIDAVTALADVPSIALFSVGGSYRKEAGSFIGPIAVSAVSRMHIDTAFIGTSGFSAQGVFSSQNTIESELKRHVIARADRSVLVADKSKIGRTAFSVFGGVEDFDLIVMDTCPGEIAELNALEERGVELLHAACETIVE